MTIRNLHHFFSPKSAVLVGATPRPGSVGLNIAQRLLRGGFKERIAFVNPKYEKVAGVRCWPSVESLPFAPQVAIIATPPPTVPGIVAELGAKGCRAAVIISAGIRGELRQAMLDAARPHLLRLIGPNCIGIQVPGAGLDASFANTFAKKGDLAILSQSGAILTAMLEWASASGIGFSHVVSLGDMADVDLGDMLDYLAGDSSSRAIFLYVEAVTHAQKFMSAARRAARVKPVIAIKAGRGEAGARAAATHTGALAGSDAVYEAALRRAGILRVHDLDEFVGAAEIISRVGHVPEKGRLVIVTNGGGAGVLAADALAAGKGTLAELGSGTLAALDQVLPATWSRANPVDIIGDAGPDRYRAAIATVLRDEEVDAALVMNCPTALASSLDAAKATAEAVKEQRGEGHSKPVIAAWLGAPAAEVQSVFNEAGIPAFSTPGSAIRGYLHLVNHAKAAAELLQAPPLMRDEIRPDWSAANALILKARERGRTMMTEPESKALLSAYGIPTVSTFIAASPAEVEAHAREILREHNSCVVKILSEQLTHKSDIGGVRLDIETAEEAGRIARVMQERISAAAPSAKLEGFTVQPMIRRRAAHELVIGIAPDRTFGPVILFGAGGTSVEAVADTAMALPPLDLKLARDLIEKTRIHRLLRGYRDRKPVDLDDLALALVRVSALAMQHPQILELDINPVLADEEGIIALDARVRIAAPHEKATPPAIRPYPRQWEAETRLRDGETVFIRPVRPDDEHLYHDFAARLDPEDIRMRLLAPAKTLPPEFIARLTQIDYAREIAFIALRPSDPPEMLGVARFFADPDYVHAEYAILVRSDLKGKGLGWALMRHLIAYARAEGLERLSGGVLRENTTMLQMCRELGFSLNHDPDDPAVVQVVLDLKNNPGASAAKLPG